MSNTPKYPNIEVQLTGQDGNAFNLLGIMRNSLKRANLPQEEVDLFTSEATAGDYNHLLNTCMDWVVVS